MVKNLSAIQEIRVQTLGRKDPLKEEMATHSSILAWRVPRSEEPGGLQSMSHRVGHDWATNTFTFHFHFKANSRNWGSLRPLEQSAPPRRPSEVTRTGMGDHREETQGSASLLPLVPPRWAPAGQQAEPPRSLVQERRGQSMGHPLPDSTSLARRLASLTRHLKRWCCGDGYRALAQETRRPRPPEPSTKQLPDQRNKRPQMSFSFSLFFFFFGASTWTGVGQSERASFRPWGTLSLPCRFHFLLWILKFRF